MHISSSIIAYDTQSKLREWSSLIGIVTAIVGNILISFALNIQRYAHIRLSRQKIGNRESGGKEAQQSKIAEERSRLNLNAPAEDAPDNDETTPLNAAFRSRSCSASTTKHSEKPWSDAEGKTYLRSPYWWAGILLMTVGEAGNFLAYGFAPASIVSPLGVVALISNCVIAPFMLKERFRRRDLLGVVVAVGGAVTVVLSAKTSETKMGPHDVWEAITRWEFELYLGVTGGLIVVLLWASGRYGEKSILIDLGLVALFGMWCMGDFDVYLSLTRRLQEATRHCLRRELHLSCPTRFGELLPSPLHTFLSPCLWRLHYYRFDISIGPCNDLTPHRSYPPNSSSSLYPLLWAVPYCIEISSPQRPKESVSSLAVVR